MKSYLYILALAIGFSLLWLGVLATIGGVELYNKWQVGNLIRPTVVNFDAATSFENASKAGNDCYCITRVLNKQVQ